MDNITEETNENTNPTREMKLQMGGETPVADDAQTTDGEPAQMLDARRYDPSNAQIKCGMSLSEAKQLPSKEFADKMLARLEDSGANRGSDAGGGGEETPDLDISALSEENGYDPEIVRVVGGLTKLVQQQAKAIAAFQKGAKPTAAKAVDTRRNLVIARPGGDSSRKGVPKGDPEAQILATMRSQFKTATDDKERSMIKESKLWQLQL